MDSSLRGNDGQVKRVSGIRHIQVETVLNQSQGGMYICAVMKISLVAPVKFFIGTWKAIRLCPLATTICAFHLGFSLVTISN